MPLALLLATVLMGATSAEVLVSARAAEADLDYPKARALIGELLARSDAAPVEVLQAHVLAGQIERTSGNDDGAREHFLIVLRKDPAWVLPDNAPPKVRTFFELLREDVQAERREAEKIMVAPTPTTTAPAKASPVAGFVVGGVGAVVVVAGAVTGVVGELGFANANADFENRAGSRAIALAGWSGVAVGVVVGVVGAALLLTAE